MTPESGLDGVNDGLAALLDAVVDVGSDLELEAILRRIVEAAVALVDCQYGALGVLGSEGEAGTLVEFLTGGIPPEQHKLIGDLPHGAGILGLLITDPRPLRLRDLTTHPQSVGFPANHPQMKSFLGVPIRVRNTVFGNLYLTEKSNGSDFNEQDQALVQTLATAAGVAIANARLYQDARNSARWQRATAEVTRALLAGQEPGDVLALVARLAREIVHADVAVIGFSDGSGTSIIEVADGDGAAQLIGKPLPLPEPGLTVPLRDRTGQVATLAVAKSMSGSRFDTANLEQLQSFAGQAALALEIAEARRDSERLLVFEDRDRIARDLHDTVIQRLFAAGMQLESVSRLADNPDITARIHSVVDDLDDTIGEIRSTIYSLQRIQRQEPMGLRARVLGLAEQLGSILGTAPAVDIDGLLDGEVSRQVGDDLVAVLREALSNVARHARASRVDVAITVSDSLLELRVCDDGSGFDESAVDVRRSGLSNIAARAQACGGFSSVESLASAGADPVRWWSTRLTWTVPLAQTQGSISRRGL